MRAAQFRARSANSRGLARNSCRLRQFIRSSPRPAGHIAPQAYRIRRISRVRSTYRAACGNSSVPPHAPQGISRRRHIASAGYLACEAHIAPLAAIHPFLAFPSRGRWRLRRMRCPPANQTDIIAEESRLHLICLASFNISPPRGRLGTPGRRGSMEKNGVKNAGKG